MSFIYSWATRSNQTNQTPAATPPTAPANANGQGVMTLTDGVQVLVQQNPTRRAPLPIPQTPNGPPDGGEEEMPEPSRKELIPLPKAETIDQFNPFANPLQLKPNPFIKQQDISPKLQELLLEQSDSLIERPKQTYIPDLNADILPKPKQASFLSKITQKVTQKVTQTYKYYTTYVDPLVGLAGLTDMQREIFSDFNLKDLNVCRRVNKSWNESVTPLAGDTILKMENVPLKDSKVLSLYSNGSKNVRLELLKNFKFHNNPIIMFDLIAYDNKNESNDPDYIDPFPFVGKELKKDREFLMKAIKNNLDAFSLVPDSYLDDLKFILDLLNTENQRIINRLMIALRDKEIKYDLRFVEELIGKNLDNFLMFCGAKLSDKQFMLDVIREHPTVITCAGKPLLTSPEFWLQAFAECESLYAFDHLYEKFSLFPFSEEITTKANAIRYDKIYDEPGRCKFDQLLNLYYKGSLETRKNWLNNSKFNNDRNIMYNLIEKAFNRDKYSSYIFDINPLLYIGEELKDEFKKWRFASRIDDLVSESFEKYFKSVSSDLNIAIKQILEERDLLNDDDNTHKSNITFWKSIFCRCKKQDFNWFKDEYYKIIKTFDDFDNELITKVIEAIGKMHGLIL